MVSPQVVESPSNDCKLLSPPSLTVDVVAAPHDVIPEMKTKDMSMPRLLGDIEDQNQNGCSFGTGGSDTPNSDSAYI